MATLEYAGKKFKVDSVKFTISPYLHKEQESKMIVIKPSPTADTRTCDVSLVDKQTLLNSSRQHIADVGSGLGFFASKLTEAASIHDYDKLSEIDWFLADFKTKFAQTGWWDNHRKIHRHHLNSPDGVPEDVNLIDVLEHIVDCVMAGMARSGHVYPLELPNELLQQAFSNTAELLKANVEVVTPPMRPECGESLYLDQFEIAKRIGDSFLIGDRVFWDDSNKFAVDHGDECVGVAMRVATATAKTVFITPMKPLMCPECREARAFSDNVECAACKNTGSVIRQEPTQ